jgi:ferritin
MSIVTDLQQATEVSRRRIMADTMKEGLNKQFLAEMESSYIYLGIATYFESLSLSGFADWFRVQSQEELSHAMRVYDFLRDRGAEIQLPALRAPSTQYGSPLHAFETGLAQEQDISLLIQELYGIAHDLREFDAATFLQWFLKEQVEEENLLGGIISKLKLGADSMGTTLLFLDKELGQRKSHS